MLTYRYLRIQPSKISRFFVEPGNLRFTRGVPVSTCAGVRNPQHASEIWPYAVNLTRSTVAAAGVKIIAALIKTPTADHSTALLARPFWRQYTLPKEVTPWD